MRFPQLWKKAPPPIAEDAIVIEPSGVSSVDMIARPLIVGNGQDPVAYAKDRLSHLAAHIEHNAGSLSTKFWDEARTETYALLHALRVHGAIAVDEEWSYLMRVIASMKPGKAD